VLGEASSHHEIWLEFHPPDDHAGAQVTAPLLAIEANLKGKARAREKLGKNHAGAQVTVPLLAIEANLKGKARAREKC
jgi:hypothetical protein